MAQRTAINYATGDQVTAVRMNTTLNDLDTLFKDLLSDNLTINWDTVNDQVSSIVDNENSITLTFTWTMYLDSVTPYFTFTDGTTTWKVSYSLGGYPISLTTI